MRKIVFFSILFLFINTSALADSGLKHFGYYYGVGSFGGVAEADIDGNCKVDIFDYNILVENFGK